MPLERMRAAAALDRGRGTAAQKLFDGDDDSVTVVETRGRSRQGDGDCAGGSCSRQNMDVPTAADATTGAEQGATELTAQIDAVPN
jgi:hypothetical protein